MGTSDIINAVRDFPCPGVELEDAAEALANADIITSVGALQILLAFIDGTLTHDMRSKGLILHKGTDGERIDLLRVTRMPEAPNALVLATVWNWNPRLAATVNPMKLHNRSSYDESWVRVATGGEPNRYGGPRCAKWDDDRVLHYRILNYEVGGLKAIVKAPVTCTVPAADAAAFDSLDQGVDVETVNRRHVTDLYHT